MQCRFSDVMVSFSNAKIGLCGDIVLRAAFAFSENGSLTLVHTVQANIGSLVRSAFLKSGRTVAHQCTKLLAQCLEHAKNLQDATVYHA